MFRLYTFILGMGLACSAFAQEGPSPIAKLVAGEKSQGARFNQINLFSSRGNVEDVPGLEKAVRKGNLLDLNQQMLDAVNLERPKTLQLSLPYGQSKKLDIDLVQVALLTDDFQHTTDKGNAPYTPGLHFRGIVNGNEKAVAAISIFGDEVVGVVNLPEVGSMVLGRIENGQKNRYAFFADQDIQSNPDFDCGTLALPEGVKIVEQRGAQGVAAVDKCIRVYFELEYDLVTEKGGATGAANFITGIFNVVATLYQNEGITTKISEIFSWTTPDSYPTSSSNSALTSFRSARRTFNGDVAHLVSRGAPTGGGIAYVDALCSGYAYAYSYIYSSYSQFPTYSWTVFVITHEMGHNLGSQHTHDCVWNGNNTAIDACAPTAGYTNSCPGAPVPAKGTIMSYCHLLSNVGIDFNLGFGPQPGDRIRAAITNAPCLQVCTSSCQTVTISKTDINCNGARTGTATANATGGVTPYAYKWSNGATTQSITGLAAGTYTVTVTGGNSCQATASVTITQPTAITLSFAATNATSGANGTINLTVSGGTPAYTYRWSNNATSEDLAGLTAGTYSVTVTDSKGCTKTGSATITSCSLSATTSKTDVNCFGASTGSATANPAGGTSPYTYRWSNNATTKTISNLPAGTYSVTVTDATGCTATSNATVTQPAAALSLTTQVTAENPAGASNGAVNLTVTGGTSPYTFRWSNNATTEDLSGLRAGTYTVTVTDSRTCTATTTANVTSVVIVNCSPLVAIPNSESFETTDLGIWTQLETEDFDWTRRSGKVPTLRTGPTAAYAGSFYMYTESDGNLRKTAILESACLDLKTVATPKLSFAYSMNGTNMGTLRVDISTNGGQSWTQLWSRSGNQGSAWLTTTLNLPAYQVVKIRFVGIIGGGSRSDMAIDAVNITNTGGLSAEPISDRDPVRIPGNKAFSGTGNILYLNAAPNPATDELLVKIQTAQEGDYQLNIMDVTGRRISNTMHVLYSGHNEIRLNVSQFRAGLYFISLNNENDQETIKFSVIR